jgi:Zn-dependent protease
MESSLSIGKIFGIPIRVHFTWFIVFILITATLIAYLPVPEPYVLWYRIVGGIVASLLFFLSIHELAHSRVAIKNNIPVKDITLFVFGGVSRISKEANRPVIEILIAVVGPLVSIAIAGIYLGIYFALSDIDTLLATLAQWLAYINALMALFNLIPGFPLDGGRILRAIIWRNTGNYMRGTRTATIVGRVIGYIFIAGGLGVMFITNQWISGLWLAFIGWFLETSAIVSYREASLRDALNGLNAGDIMDTNFPSITGNATIQQIVHHAMLTTGNKWFIVVSSYELEGMISLKNIKNIPQEQWDSTTVKSVMIPKNSLFTVNPAHDGLYVLENMEERNLLHVPVIENENIIGVISYDNLLRLPKIRSELKMHKQQ